LVLGSPQALVAAWLSLLASCLRSTQLDNINDEIINDPTLQRDMSVECPNCRVGADGKRYGAVFFQATSAATSDDKMSMIYVCCNPECLHKWQM
jgi:hypothetical protein